MRQVQKEMKVLTVTEISTMVPASAILPITVKTGNNALIVRDSMHRKTEAAHRRLTAVTALIATLLWKFLSSAFQQQRRGR